TSEMTYTDDRQIPLQCRSQFSVTRSTTASRSATTLPALSPAKDVRIASTASIPTATSSGETAASGGKSGESTPLRRLNSQSHAPSTHASIPGAVCVTLVVASASSSNSLPSSLASAATSG